MTMSEYFFHFFKSNLKMQPNPTQLSLLEIQGSSIAQTYYQKMIHDLSDDLGFVSSFGHLSDTTLDTKDSNSTEPLEVFYLNQQITKRNSEILALSKEILNWIKHTLSTLLIPTLDQTITSDDDTTSTEYYDTLINTIFLKLSLILHSYHSFLGDDY